jgi:hypothetical protein
MEGIVNSLKSIMVLSMLIILTGCATAGEETHKQGEHHKRHYEKSLYKVAEAGNYSVEMMIKDNMFNVGVNAADIIIHDKNDNEVVGANITFTPWMPEMGHGVFTAPGITERGGGLYRIEDVTLVMGGFWEMKIEIEKDNVKDMVVFEFKDVRADTGHSEKHKHEMVVTRAPSDLDLSTSSLSSNKTFKVSYTSDRDPAPVNRIHSWTLNVLTADGKPVTGAIISLNGNMPEHGHGLPTEPEVTQEISSGEYLVEGMKFSMPGWWVIDFNIKSGDKQDTVKFNLILK